MRAVVRQIDKTPKNIEIENVSDRAIPNIDDCATASPKYAIFRHTIKQPRGAAAIVNAIPAKAARTKKLSNSSTNLTFETDHDHYFDRDDGGHDYDHKSP